MHLSIFIVLGCCFILIFTTNSTCSTICVPMPYYQCYICYCQQNQEFLRCEQFYCQSQDCFRNDYRQMTVSLCFTECCREDLSNQPFSSQLVTKCEQGNIEILQLTNLIPFIAFGLSIIIVSFIAACFCRKHLRSRRSEQIGHSDTNLRIIEDERWQYCGDNIFNQNQQCTVCLNKETEIETECGHAFHVDCLASWVRVKDICPNCMKGDIQIVKYFCSGCHRSFALTNIKSGESIDKFKAQMYKSQCLICMQKSQKNTHSLDN